MSMEKNARIQRSLILPLACALAHMKENAKGFAAFVGNPMTFLLCP